MDASFRCWIILAGAMLVSYVAWRLAQPSLAREAARYGAYFLDPVVGMIRDGPSDVTLVLTGELSHTLPHAGGQITLEDRLNADVIESGPPIEAHGVGTLRFRDVYQRSVGYPLTFSRTAFTRVDGQLVCLSRFGLTADGPGAYIAHATTVYPAAHPAHHAEAVPEPAPPPVH